jgi:hypothetical protein
LMKMSIKERHVGREPRAMVVFRRSGKGLVNREHGR